VGGPWVVTGANGGDLAVWDDSGDLSSTDGKELRSFYARLRGFGGYDHVTRIAGISHWGNITACICFCTKPRGTIAGSTHWGEWSKRRTRNGSPSRRHEPSRPTLTLLPGPPLPPRSTLDTRKPLLSMNITLTFAPTDL
jgi:hypothetical protein